MFERLTALPIIPTKDIDGLPAIISSSSLLIVVVVGQG